MWISGLRRVNCLRNEPANTGVLVLSDWRGSSPQVLEDRPQTELIRRPVSRVLSRALRPVGDHSSGTPLAGRLARPTRTEREGAPVSCETPVPIRSCSRRGLPCHPCYQERGGLLPHPFTLTSLRQRLREAVCFLWRYPSAHHLVGDMPGGRYPPPCLRGARTFLQWLPTSGRPAA